MPDPTLPQHPNQPPATGSAVSANAPQPAPGHKTADGPGRPDPLKVNMPAAKVGTRRQPGDDPPDLRLPHERDQSAVDVAEGAPDPMMTQAAKDLADGQVDTDLRNASGLDAEQRERLLKRPG